MSEGVPSKKEEEERRKKGKINQNDEKQDDLLSFASCDKTPEQDAIKEDGPKDVQPKEEGDKEEKNLQAVDEKPRDLLAQIFPDVIEIEGKIFHQDHDTEDNKGHQKGIAEDIEQIIKKLKGRRKITEACHLALPELDKRLLNLKGILMPEGPAEFKIGLGKIRRKFDGVIRRFDGLIRMTRASGSFSPVGSRGRRAAECSGCLCRVSTDRVDLILLYSRRGFL